MKRVFALTGLVAAGALSVTVAAFQQTPPAAPGGAAGGQGRGPQGPPVVNVEKVKDNFFMLTGGGGNTGVFITTSGVTVVDAKNPGWGQPILDKIKTLTDKPVTVLINTHTHGDHTSGNVDFPATVDIVTHDNAKASMEKMPIFATSAGKGLPKRTFKDRLTVGSGNDRVDLYYFGAGHTNGDALVVFPALRMMHAGDLFSGKNIPLIDAANGGSGVAYPDTLTKAAAGISNVDSIITGHSTVMPFAALKEYADFNRDFLTAVRDGKKAGKTVDEIAGSWTIPSQYTGYTMPQAARLRTNVDVTYREIQ